MINDSDSFLPSDNNLCVFKSNDDILILIYAKKNCSIISYNLINNQIIIEIKNAHNDYISNFRHYMDNINKRDFILSLSPIDNNIKLWNIKNWNWL